MALGTRGGYCLVQRSWLNVTHIHKLGVLGVLGNGIKMVFGNAPATHQGEADFAIDYGGVRHVKVQSEPENGEAGSGSSMAVE